LIHTNQQTATFVETLFDDWMLDQNPVLVAYAQKVQLISKSNRKDDRHDARTLARLARIDPELLGPVRHRSAKAQIHLTVIRARRNW
jgi:hypothetical protein